MYGGGGAGRTQALLDFPQTGLVWGGTHLHRGLLVGKLIHRSEHGVRRALVGSEVGGGPGAGGGQG